MQYLPTIARVLLGLYFLIFGLNGFFHFLPQPPMPDEAGKAIGAIFTPSYQFNLVKAIEVLGGLALLSNRFVGRICLRVPDRESRLCPSWCLRAGILFCPQG